MTSDLSLYVIRRPIDRRLYRLPLPISMGGAGASIEENGMASGTVDCRDPLSFLFLSVPIVLYLFALSSEEVCSHSQPQTIQVSIQVLSSQ